MTAQTRTVREIMRTEFVSLAPGDKLDFVDDIMKIGRIRHFPVIEGDALVGIVSHRDLLAASLTRILEFEGTQRRSFLRSIEVSEVMSKDVRSVRSDTALAEAARLMVIYKVGCLPVVDEGVTAVGLITETDLLEAAYLQKSAE